MRTSQLIEAAEKTSSGAPNIKWEYEYDLAGNRTSAVTTPASGGQTIYHWAYNDANQIATQHPVQHWAHDVNGNLTSTPTRTLAYNDREQFTAATNPTYSATYLGVTNDERTAAQSAGNTLAYALSPLGLSRVSTSSIGVTAMTRLPNGEPVGIRYSNGNTLYLTLDHLGTPTATTTPLGQEAATFAYDPYGQPRHTHPGLGVIGYAGGVEDPGGLIKFGARYYDPHTGRFTQMDPAGQENNPYAYAANNPVNYIDPTGTSAWAAATIFVEAIGGGFSVLDLIDVLTSSGGEQRRKAAELAVSFTVGTLCTAAVAAASVSSLGLTFALTLGCEGLATLAGEAVS